MSDRYLVLNANDIPIIADDDPPMKKGTVFVEEVMKDGLSVDLSGSVCA